MSDYETNEVNGINVSRRKFLTTAGAGIAVMGAAGEFAAPLLAQTPTPPGQSPVLPPIKLPEIEAPTERQGPPPTAAPPDKRLGFAVVGLGHLSLEEILPAFAQTKRCKPTALVSGDPAKMKQVAQQYGIAEKNLYNYQNYDTLKDNPDVDIIYIVLPNSMHAEYTVRGAQAGKHILCEKPMANSVKECQQMIAACNAANKKLMIAYRIQYEPYNRQMMQMARGRELGAIKVIEMVNGQNQGGDLNQWRLKKSLAGGGSLPDVGIYCLNTARFVTGEEPIEIQASQYSAPGDPRFREVEETVTWTMRFPSGIQVNAACSYGFHETRRYRVAGSDAWAEMSPAFPYRGLRLMVGRKNPTNPMMENKEERILNEKNQFALEMDHIAECVQENKKPFTPGEEGLQDIRLISLIYEAAQTGKKIIIPAQTGMDLYRGLQPSMA